MDDGSVGGRSLFLAMRPDRMNETVRILEGEARNEANTHSINRGSTDLLPAAGIMHTMFSTLAASL